MGPYEFVKLQAEMKPDNMASSYFSDDRDLEWYRDKKGYDWQDEVYRTAFTQNYSISVAGGSPKGTKNATLYNLSFSALDQDGILLNSNFQRYQGRINFTQDLGAKVRSTPTSTIRVRRRAASPRRRPTTLRHSPDG